MKNGVTVDRRQIRIIRELSEKGLSKEKRKQLYKQLKELKRLEYVG